MQAESLIYQQLCLWHAHKSSHIACLQGLLEFLAYEPFYHSHVWRALLQKPLLGNHPDAKTPLRSLMQGVMLRRTRAHVGTRPAPALPHSSSPVKFVTKGSEEGVVEADIDHCTPAHRMRDFSKYSC